jgi:multidrug transporter EmrE-like cation transporter
MDPTFLLVCLISSSECIGEICLKKLHLNPDRFWLFIVAVVFYTIVCFLLFISYRYKGMGIIHVLWSGISILLVLGVSVFYFKEKITTLDKLGIICIIAGMVLILWKNETEYDHVKTIMDAF